MEDLTPHHKVYYRINSNESPDKVYYRINTNEAPPCSCCPRELCPYLGNPPAIAAVARRGRCPFNPPAGDVEKVMFEDPLKKSKREAKGMRK